MTPYEQFINEISKSKKERKPIRFIRKLKYEIAKDRLNYLFDEYFLQVIDDERYQSFFYRDEDLSTLMVILRYHFRLWIEFDDKHHFIKVYKTFPSKFELIKEVNKQNHWFTPKTFKKGTIMHYVSNSYGTANRMNGIPLSEDLTPIEGTNLIPSIQINYDFIKPIYNH